MRKRQKILVKVRKTQWEKRGKVQRKNNVFGKTDFGKNRFESVLRFWSVFQIYDRKTFTKLTSKMCEITSKRRRNSMLENVAFFIESAHNCWSQNYLNCRKCSKRQHELILIAQINCFLTQSFHLCLPFSLSVFDCLRMKFKRLIVCWEHKNIGSLHAITLHRVLFFV